MRSTIFTLFSALLISCTFASCSKTTSGSGDPSDLSESDLSAKRDARFGEGSIPVAEGEGLFRDVHFDFDSTLIGAEARNDLEYDAQVLKDRPELRVQLEGHCDERGTADYNLTLGLQRAKVVEQQLISLGVPASRIETISYGEEVPLDPGHTESAWAKNRRVHFSAFGSETK